MSRYLLAVLLVLTFGTSAFCATKPIKPAAATNPNAEYFAAITKGNIAKVQTLITANPKLVQAKSKDGKTGLQLALAQKKPDIAALLRKNGALDELPIVSISVSGNYTQPGLSEDGTKKYMPKWILRAEMKNADKRKWCVLPNFALFHTADKKPVLPIVTLSNIPDTFQAIQELNVLYDWESCLMQTVYTDTTKRGFSNISTWDMVMNSDDIYEEDTSEDELAPWLVEVLQVELPTGPTGDYSFASTLTLEGKSDAWTNKTIGPGQSLTADWESLSLASPDELNNMGVAEGATHQLTLVGPIIYNPDDANSGVFVAISKASGPLSAPAKFAKPEIVQLTSKYIKGQLDGADTAEWKAYFITLLADQTRVFDKPDEMLITVLQGSAKYGPLVSGTAGVCLEKRKFAGAISSLTAIASDSKTPERMRNRIVNDLYLLDSPAVRDCLKGIAANTGEQYLIRMLALTSYSKCPQCDWAVVEGFKQDKTLQTTATTLIDMHNKSLQPK